MNARVVSNCFFFFLPLFLLFQTLVHAERRTYVVYLGGHSHGPEATPTDFQRATDRHYRLLESVAGSKKVEVIYSYTKNINAFAAKMDEEEASALLKHPDVISVFLNNGVKLHTTHSWEFMALERDKRVPRESLWTKANFGEDVIIANLDTGVWPESESFLDDGMGSVPSRWKGFCQNNTKEGVPCNRKLIGARYFKEAYEADLGYPINFTYVSPRDGNGHGTHTLSTAAGRFVPGASFFGHANGTSKGGSPRARVATYKVCWPYIKGECYDADILAGIEAAIDDGVDVLSVSLGGFPFPYDEDALAIGTFHAVMKGIPVVCSAGNSGPFLGTASNLAPWIFTVAASTSDRRFTTYLTLGNNEEFKGKSFSYDRLLQKMYPLINSIDAVKDGVPASDAQYCSVGSLDPAKVEGKIVVCLRGSTDRVEKGLVVRNAGGVGMILANDEFDYDIVGDPHFLPAIHVTYEDGLKIYSYINSTQSPMAYIGYPEELRKPAPVMASFSSRGPNLLTPEILKPDITAPGVEILASYSQNVSASGSTSDSRTTPFIFMDGTSMSCPHISGVVGLLKSLHPDWSPSAIRSAIMTTARTQDNAGQPILDYDSTEATPLHYGAGHVRPNRAMDPGLIYDLTNDDYLNLLCAFGYNSTAWDPHGRHKCPSENVTILDFNYPSITVPRLRDAVLITRKVKNVGAPSTYTARLHLPPGVSISIEPQILKFKKIGEEKTFKMYMTLKGGFLPDYSFGRLEWFDGKHHVRSPIVVSSQ